MNAAMQYLKLATTPGNPILRIAMGPDGTNFAFIELRTEQVCTLLAPVLLLCMYVCTYLYHV